VKNNSSIKLVLILLLLIPAIINFYTPLYNYANPTAFGLPFFWWFQIVILALTTIPYLVFSYIEGKRNPETLVRVP